MSLLDGVKAAVLGTAAARTGYLSGQHQGEEENKRDQRENDALARQSRLDAIKAQLDAAQIRDDTSRANYYDHQAERPLSPTDPPPHTISTDSGIMRWDPDQKKFVPTGLQPPERASDRAAARSDAREARQAAKDQVQSTKDALGGVRQQITDSQRDLHDETGVNGNDDQTRIGQIRQRLDSLGGVSDSLNAVLQRRSSGAPTASSSPPSQPRAVQGRAAIRGGGAPSPVKRAITADQADYLRTSMGMTDAQIQAKYDVTP